MPPTCVHKKVFKLENYENKVLNFVVFKMKVNSMYRIFAHKAVIEGMYGVYHTVLCTCNLHGWCLLFSLFKCS